MASARLRRRLIFFVLWPVGGICIVVIGQFVGGLLAFIMMLVWVTTIVVTAYRVRCPSCKSRLPAGKYTLTPPKCPRCGNEL